MDKWINKCGYVHVNEILFRPRRKSSHFAMNMDEPCRHYAKEQARHKRANTILLYLHEVSRVESNSQRQKVEYLVTRGWEKGEMGSCCLMDEKFSSANEMSGNGCVQQ